MPHQALTPKEQRLKKLAQMRIDSLRKMAAGRSGLGPGQSAPSHPKRPARAL